VDLYRKSDLLRKTLEEGISIAEQEERMRLELECYGEVVRPLEQKRKSVSQ
jgi:hypothetical protein